MPKIVYRDQSYKAIGLSMDAVDIEYDNAGSGLDAATIQSAIDELAEGSGDANKISYDNTIEGVPVTNVEDALDELVKNGDIGSIANKDIYSLFNK